MTLKTVIILSLVIILFIGTYLLNNKVPKPDGCEKSDKCSTCQMKNCYVKNNITEGEKHERQ